MSMSMPEHIFNTIPWAVLSQHIFAGGKPGAGKSSKLRVLVEAILDAGQRTCIIDPKGDWWGLKSSADGQSAGFPLLIFGGEHADLPLPANAGGEIGELVASGGATAVLIDTSLMDVAERTRFFMAFARALFQHMRGALHLIIDECHNFAPQGKVLSPDAGKMLHWANRLASEGRGRGITLLSASQRPQKVHKDYLTTHETLIACRLIHPLDRNAFKEWMNGADPVFGRKVLADLAAMPRAEAWVWSPEIGYGPERITFPLFRTFDSFSPRKEEAKIVTAAVDIAAVRDKLETMVKEAESNAPDKLRERIAVLEKELRQSAGRIYTQAQVDRMIADALRADREALPQGEATTQLPAIDEYAAVLENGRRALKEIWTLSGNAMNAIAAQIDRGDDGSQTYVNPLYSTVSSEQGIARIRTRQSPGLLPSDEPTSSPMQKVLQAFIWWESTGLPPPYTKVQIAFVAGYTPSSGGFNNILGKLRGAGLIVYPAPGMASLTPAGREKTSPVESMPDNETLHQCVLSKLNPPQQRVMRWLLKAYPEPMTKEQLALGTGYSSGSGGFNNILGSLRSLQLITYPRKGCAVALPFLFIQ
jgi:uncharacterized protein